MFQKTRTVVGTLVYRAPGPRAVPPQDHEGGLSIAAAAIILAIACVQLATHLTVDPILIVGIAVTTGVLAFWWLAVRPDWIKIAADAYAFELLAACDRLTAKTAAARQKKPPA